MVSCYQSFSPLLCIHTHYVVCSYILLQLTTATHSYCNKIFVKSSVWEFAWGTKISWTTTVPHINYYISSNDHNFGQSDKQTLPCMFFSGCYHPTRRRKRGEFCHLFLCSWCLEQLYNIDLRVDQYTKNTKNIKSLYIFFNYYCLHVNDRRRYCYFPGGFSGPLFKTGTRRPRVKYSEYTFFRTVFYIKTQQCFKQVPIRMGENCKNYIAK